MAAKHPASGSRLPGLLLQRYLVQDLDQLAAVIVDRTERASDRSRLCVHRLTDLNRHLADRTWPRTPACPKSFRMQYHDTNALWLPVPEGDNGLQAARISELLTSHDTVVVGLKSCAYPNLSVDTTQASAACRFALWSA
jgi:hypothetical protein